MTPKPKDVADAWIIFMTYLDQSPLVWAVLTIGLIFISFWVEEKNKLTADLCLLLAGNMMSRIRSKKNEPNP